MTTLRLLAAALLGLCLTTHLSADDPPMKVALAGLTGDKIKEGISYELSVKPDDAAHKSLAEQVDFAKGTISYAAPAHKIVWQLPLKKKLTKAESDTATAELKRLLSESVGQHVVAQADHSVLTDANAFSGAEVKLVEPMMEQPAPMPQPMPMDPPGPSAEEKLRQGAEKDREAAEAARQLAEAKRIQAEKDRAAAFDAIKAEWEDLKKKFGNQSPGSKAPRAPGESKFEDPVAYSAGDCESLAVASSGRHCRRRARCRGISCGGYYVASSPASCQTCQAATSVESGLTLAARGEVPAIRESLAERICRESVRSPADSTHRGETFASIEAGDAVSPLSDPQGAAEYFAEAYHAFWQKDDAAALQLLRNGLSLNSEDPRLWYYQGMIELRQGKEEQGVRSLAVAVRLHSAGKVEPSLVSRSLERVQGAFRQELEVARQKVALLPKRPQPIEPRIAGR